MIVQQTLRFKKSVKKLPRGQKKHLDEVVRLLRENPEAGEAKVGDLADIRVYKFRLNKQLMLLGYSYNDNTITLTLLALASHENFYRDLKRG